MDIWICKNLEEKIPNRELEISKLSGYFLSASKEVLTTGYLEGVLCRIFINKVMIELQMFK